MQALEPGIPISHLNFTASLLSSQHLFVDQWVVGKEERKEGRQAGLSGSFKKTLNEGMILSSQIQEEACRGQETCPK